MALEHIGEQGRDRMVPEIARDIGHADPIVLVPFAVGERRLLREAISDPDPGAPELILGRIRQHQAAEGLKHRLARLKPRIDAGFQACEIMPVAAMQPADGEVAPYVFDVEAVLEQPFVIPHRRFEPLEHDQHVGAAVADFGIGGIERERFLIARESFVVASEHAERCSIGAERLRLIGFQRQRFLRTVERLAVALHTQERRRAIVQDQRPPVIVVRIELVEGRERVLVALHLQQRNTPVVARFDVVGPQHERAGEACKRLLEAAQRLERAAAAVEQLGDFADRT